MMMMLMLMIRLRLMLMMMSRLAATTLAPDNISHQRHTHPYDAPHYDPAFPFSPKPPSRMLQDLPKLSFPINYQSGFSCLSPRFYLGRNHNSFGKNTHFLSFSPSFPDLKKPVFPILVHITKEFIALVDFKHKQSFNMSTNHVLHRKKSSSSELHPSCAPAISNELFCGAHCAPFSSPCMKRAGWISTFNS